VLGYPAGFGCGFYVYRANFASLSCRLPVFFLILQAIREKEIR
jgi:hypothetical protein